MKTAIVGTEGVALKGGVCDLTEENILLEYILRFQNLQSGQASFSLSAS